MTYFKSSLRFRFIGIKVKSIWSMQNAMFCYRLWQSIYMRRVNVMATWEQERDMIQELYMASKGMASKYTSHRPKRMNESLAYELWIRCNDHGKFECFNSFLQFTPWCTFPTDIATCRWILSWMQMPPSCRAQSVDHFSYRDHFNRMHTCNDMAITKCNYGVLHTAKRTYWKSRPWAKMDGAVQQDGEI